MQKNIYVGGFLYHPLSDQILLQQSSVPTQSLTSWLLFGGLYLEEEDPETIFRKIVAQLLDIKVKEVYPIYSYFNENTERDQFIGYAEVNKLYEFEPKNGFSFSWFSFKDVLKLEASKQVKHDIVVGQRVIAAARRRVLGEHTF